MRSKSYLSEERKTHKKKVATASGPLKTLAQKNVTEFRNGNNVLREQSRNQDFLEEINTCRTELTHRLR